MDRVVLPASAHLPARVTLRRHRPVGLDHGPVLWLGIGVVGPYNAGLSPEATVGDLLSMEWDTKRHPHLRVSASDGPSAWAQVARLLSLQWAERDGRTLVLDPGHTVAQALWGTPGFDALGTDQASLATTLHILRAELLRREGNPWASFPAWMVHLVAISDWPSDAASLISDLARRGQHVGIRLVTYVRPTTTLTDWPVVLRQTPEPSAYLHLMPAPEPLGIPGRGSYRDRLGQPTELQVAEPPRSFPTGWSGETIALAIAAGEQPTAVDTLDPTDADTVDGWRLLAALRT